MYPTTPLVDLAHLGYRINMRHSQGRPFTALSLSLGLGLAAACSPSDDAATSKSETGDTNSESETGASQAVKPVLMELLSSAALITEGEPITFTALVVDPQGLDTIVGGKLLSEDGKVFYGAFAHVGGGTFQLALTWGLINQSLSINFDGDEEVRVFTADFFDIEGHHATASIDIRLDCTMAHACDGECVDLGACDGHCSDRNNDGANCGKCGNRCLSYCEQAFCDL